MALATSLQPPTELTYEQYLAEPETEGRYDILEGVRYFMSGATWKHQKIAFKIAKMLDQYRERTGNGEVIMAPFDVLIRRVPKLQTRQPDIFFISNAQLAQGGGIPDKGPLEVAPELVVEIISDTETGKRVAEKLADYVAIGVQECWLVDQSTRTVEIKGLSANSFQSTAKYHETQLLQSLVFPDLTLPVSDFFTA